MPKSIYKSTNSLQNIILLLLFVVGLFVLYRYVKTIETETKLLQNHLIELTEKIQFLLNNTNNSQSAPKLTSPKLPHTEYVDVVIDDDKLNDTMSIQSEDITNMLRKVIGGGNDEDVDEDIIANMMVDVNGDEVENNVKIEEIVEDDDYEKEKEKEEKEKEEEEDAIIISNTNTDEVTLKSLSKKTNEELKTMLKEKSLLTKGTKSELVERLLSNM